MNIALVNPSINTRYSQPPLGLLALAAVCRAEGNNVRIVDANARRLTDRELLVEVAGSRVVGITAMTPTISEAQRVARLIKQAFPAVAVVLGGVHASIFPEETMAGGEFDVVVAGEGEYRFIEIVDTLRGGGTLQSIYRANGTCALDRQPMAAFDLLDMPLYNPHPPHGRQRPWLPVITSRGCPFNCSFCSKAVFGREYRAMSAPMVIAMLRDLKKAYGIREVSFYDDVFTVDKQRTLELCDLLPALKLSWSCETRVNLVDGGLLEAMKRAGCHAIAYGIESGDQGILDGLSKGVQLGQVEAAVRYTREAGIQTVGYFMLGAPGETAETMDKTANFAIRLGLDYAQFGVTCPLPGSRLYEEYLGMGYEKPDWSAFCYVGNDNAPMFADNGLGRYEIREAVRQASHRFYLRPAYMYRRLGDLVKHPAMVARGVRMFARNGK